MEFKELKSLQNRREQKIKYSKEKIINLELQKVRLEANENVLKHPLMLLIFGVFIFLYQQFISSREEIGLVGSFVASTSILVILGIIIIIYLRALRTVIEHKFILEIVINEKKEYEKSLKSKMRFVKNK